MSEYKVIKLRNNLGTHLVVDLSSNASGADTIKLNAPNASSYVYWRPLVIGNASSQLSTNLQCSDQTSSVFTFNTLKAQPSTGSLILSGRLTSDNVVSNQITLGTVVELSTSGIRTNKIILEGDLRLKQTLANILWTQNDTAFRQRITVSNIRSNTLPFSLDTNHQFRFQLSSNHGVNWENVASITNSGAFTGYLSGKMTEVNLNLDELVKTDVYRLGGYHPNMPAKLSLVLASKNPPRMTALTEGTSTMEPGYSYGNLLVLKQHQVDTIAQVLYPYLQGVPVAFRSGNKVNNVAWDSLYVSTTAYGSEMEAELWKYFYDNKTAHLFLPHINGKKFQVLEVANFYALTQSGDKDKEVVWRNNSLTWGSHNLDEMFTIDGSNALDYFGFTVSTDANNINIFTKVNPNRDLYLSRWFKVCPGEDFHVSYSVKSDCKGATTNGGSTIGYGTIKPTIVVAKCIDISGNFVGVSYWDTKILVQHGLCDADCKVTITEANKGNWHDIDYYFKVPLDVNFIKFDFIVDVWSPITGTLQIKNFKFHRAPLFLIRYLD